MLRSQAPRTESRWVQARNTCIPARNTCPNTCIPTRNTCPNTCIPTRNTCPGTCIPARNTCPNTCIPARTLARTLAFRPEHLPEHLHSAPGTCETLTWKLATHPVHVHAPDPLLDLYLDTMPIRGYHASISCRTRQPSAPTSRRRLVTPVDVDSVDSALGAQSLLGFGRRRKHPRKICNTEKRKKNMGMVVSSRGDQRHRKVSRLVAQRSNLRSCPTFPARPDRTGAP